MIGLRRKRQHPGAISLEGHAELSDEYFELARLWISPEQGRTFALVGFMEQWSPELLGSLLVESVHTAAAAFAIRDGMPEEEALQRIWRGFDDERASLGSAPSKETN